MLTKIENLHDKLELNENNIKSMEGMSHLPNLTTLNLSKNALNDVRRICHLKDCTVLTAVDLSGKNQLCGKDIIQCLRGMTKVMSLNMAGNHVVPKVAYL